MSSENVSTERIILTPLEIRLAFKFFSKDGKKVTRDDIKLQLERFFPNLSVKDYKLLVNGGFKDANLAAHESMTEQAWFKAVNVKEGDSAPDYYAGSLKKDRYDGRGIVGFSYEDPFNLFEPSEGGKIPESVMRGIASHVRNESEQAAHFNYAAFLQYFDLDKDGEIDINDFKNMKIGSSQAKI